MEGGGANHTLTRRHASNHTEIDMNAVLGPLEAHELQNLEQLLEVQILLRAHLNTPASVQIAI